MPERASGRWPKNNKRLMPTTRGYKHLVCLEHSYHFFFIFYAFKPRFATRDVKMFIGCSNLGWDRLGQEIQEAETTPPICSPKSAEAACQGQATEQNHSVSNGFCTSLSCVKLYQPSWCWAQLVALRLRYEVPNKCAHCKRNALHCISTYFQCRPKPA